MVARLAKYPKKVIRQDSAKKTAKKSRVKLFVKLVDRFKTGKNRYAGKKAVIVRVFEEGTRDRPYGNCQVAGLAKYPKKVIRKDSAKKTANKYHVKGRYAGKKVVIVRVFEEGTHDRPYEHCLVADLAKYPKKVIRKDSAKKTAKKSRVQVFLKLEDRFKIDKNRYAGKKAVIVCVFEEGTRDRPYGHWLVVVLAKYPKKVIRKDSAKKTAKKSHVKVFLKLEDRFKTGKNRIPHDLT
ncbi:60S ribosomal protein L27-3 [Hordeum vulgare]|nr:60S ribosomal protein L27-3 [Hordeum vulgare]